MRAFFFKVDAERKPPKRLILISNLLVPNCSLSPAAGAAVTGG